MSGVRAFVMMLGCFAAVGGWANTSLAQVCSDNSGCPKGYSCEVTGMSGCAAVAPAPSNTPPAGGAGGASAKDGGAAPADDAGTAGASFAPPPPDQPVPGCEPQEYRSCVPGKCANDSDCADGMVCHERSIGTCTSAAIAPCAPNTMCPDAGPPVCTERVEHICVPRYLLPCETAAECGTGFTCEPQLTMVCSGGGWGGTGAASGGTGGAASSGTAGTSAVDAGAAMDPAPNTPAEAPAPADAGAPSDPKGDFAAPVPPQPPVECHAEPTQLKYCKPLDKECKTDQDCPTLFYCVSPTFDLPVIPMCVAPADGDGGTCGSYDAGQPTTRAPSYCSPRYGEPAVDVAFPQRPSTPGTATGAGGKGGTTSGAIPPSAQPGGQQADAGVLEGEGADDSNHVEACSVATPGAVKGSPTWFAALFSFVAAWVVSRRRR